MKMKLDGYISISLFLLLVLTGCSNGLTGDVVYASEEALVVDVIDGDTVETEDGTRIRLLGVNTPEVNEDYYIVAKDALKKLVLNKTVMLVEDIQDKDKYGRDLRYMYIGEVFVNSYLIENGYAKTLSIEPNTRFSEEFALAEREAIDKGVGVWGIDQRNACVVMGCEEGTKYIASKNSKVYHDCSCSKTSRSRIKEVVCFASLGDIPKGYRESKLC